MKQKLVTLFVVLFIALPLFAQSNSTSSFSIKGQVIDSLSSESVPYATLKIVLANAPAQTVKLLACDDDGRFETALNTPGSYLISIQSVGKVPTQKGFTLEEGNKKVDLGKLLIADDTQLLGEVTVSAQKPLVRVEIDKISYSLEDDPEAKTNNTLEMLRKVPMVTVDGDDKIQLKGSTNFKIYMNGKPSNLLSNNPSDVLKSMPASSVKDIEVITDPGAKYDAEGIGGIINIITHKNSSLQGFTGTVRASGSTMGHVSGGGYLSAKIGKLGLTANYNYSRQNSPWNNSISTRENLVSDTQYKLIENGRYKHKGPFQFGNLEASYEIDSLNLLSVGANLFNGRMSNITEQDVTMFDRDGKTDYSYDRNSTNKGTFGSTNVNVDYQRSTRKKDELITLSYRYSNSPDDSEANIHMFNVNNYGDGATLQQRNDNDASTTEHTGQLDYTTPVRKDHTLEVGAKYINRQSRSATERYILDNASGNWNNISTNSDNFRHTQHIYSGYLGYAMRLSKVGLKAGVRAEGTALDVKFSNEPTMNFETDYFDVVPNATISYQLSMAQQIRLGYNMRISRPSIWYLNPYVNDANKENIRYGNPNLDSEKSNNVSLNYSTFTQKFNMNASLSYSFVNNSIEQYTFIDPMTPGISYTTYDNIGRRQQLGGFLYASWNPIPLIRIYMNGGLNYVDMKSEKMNLSNSGFNGNIFAGGQLNFPHDFRVNLNGGYYAPWIQLQGKGSSFYFVGVTLNKDFLKKKLTVSLSTQNPFWKDMKMTSKTTAETFRQESINYRTARMFNLSVSYRFGSMKEQIKKVRRGITNDDMKSGGGSGGDQGGGNVQQ